MKNERKTPEIRITGFKDDWEHKRFDRVFDFLQNNTLSRAALNYENGTIKNIHYGDILVKFGEYVDVSKEKLPFINDDSSVSKFTNSFLRDGDIIIADTAEDYTVGKCTEIVSCGSERLLAGLHTIPCRPKEKYAPKFLGYYMNSDSYHRPLIPLMQGTKVKSISKHVLESSDMVMPSSEKEQSIIGDYFSELDSMIEIHQKEIDRLMCVRMAMVERMFPKDGADVPAVRFSQYKKPWVLRKFTDIFIERHIIDTLSDEYPQLAFTIEEGVIRPEDKKTNKRDFLIIDKANKKYLQTEYDDIIYNPANVIYGAIHRNALGKGCVSPIYKIFYTDQDSTFMECIVRHPRFIKEISRSMEGTVKKLRTLKPKAFLEMSAYIAPTIEEQKQIGEYFRQIDKLIEIEKEELEKIKHIKCACLEKMFV